MSRVKDSFNPCSGGLAVGTVNIMAGVPCTRGFNPCSGGLAVGTRDWMYSGSDFGVSILVLVD